MVVTAEIHKAISLVNTDQSYTNSNISLKKIHRHFDRKSSSLEIATISY